MKIQSDTSFDSKKTLIFLRWYPNEKNFDELTSDDFFSIDDVSVSESNGFITYSHFEHHQFYKTLISNLSEVTEKFQFLVELTLEKKNYYNSKTVTGMNMKSIRLMTYEILSKNESLQLLDWPNEKIINKTHTLLIRPIWVTKKDCQNGKYELNLIIKEFIRDNRLNDLGI